jgi:hypothetical protein
MTNSNNSLKEALRQVKNTPPYTHGDKNQLYLFPSSPSTDVFFPTETNIVEIPIVSSDTLTDISIGGVVSGRKNVKQYYKVSNAEFGKAGNLPYTVISELKDHLRDNTFIYLKVQYKDSGKIGYVKVPVKKRGNAAYARVQDEAMDNRVKKLIKLADVKRCEKEADVIYTNILFLTCTLKHNPMDYESVDNTWKLFKGFGTGDIQGSVGFRRYLGRMKNAEKTAAGFDKVVGYIQSIEAHLSGACHAHYALVLDKKIKCVKTVEMKRDKDGNMIEKVFYRASQDVENVFFEKYKAAFGEENVGKIGGGFDVQGCYSVDGLGGYLGKEICKQHGSIEGVLKKADRSEDLTDSEKKRLLLHYYAGKHKIDFVRASRNLSGKPPSPDNGSGGGDNGDNTLDLELELNDTPEVADWKDKYIVLESIRLTPALFKELRVKKSEISPYSGELRESLELFVATELIEYKIGLKNSGVERKLTERLVNGNTRQ